MQRHFKSSFLHGRRGGNLLELNQRMFQTYKLERQRAARLRKYKQDYATGRNRALWSRLQAFEDRFPGLGQAVWNGITPTCDPRNDSEWGELEAAIIAGTNGGWNVNKVTHDLDDVLVATVTYRQCHDRTSVGDRFTATFFENLRRTAIAACEVKGTKKVCFWVDKVATNNFRGKSKNWASTGLMPYFLFTNLLVDSGVYDYESRFWIVVEQLAAATGFGTFTLRPQLMKAGEWVRAHEGLFMRLGGLYDINQSIHVISRDILNVESAGFELSWESDRSNLVEFSIDFLSREQIGATAEEFGEESSQERFLTLKDVANIVSRIHNFDVDRNRTYFRSWKMPTRESSSVQGCWDGTREWLPPAVADRTAHLSVRALMEEIANFTTWEIWKAGEQDTYGVGVLSLNGVAYQSMVVRLQYATCDPENHVISSQRLWPVGAKVRRGESREVIVEWLKQMDRGRMLLSSLTKLGILEGRDVKWTGLRCHDEGCK